MHLTDQEAELLKGWVTKKLDSVSDADSDVLADYVLALVRTDDPEPVARANCIENLRDFLQGNVDSFVNSVFDSLRTKAYDPTHTPAAPTLNRKRPLEDASNNEHDGRSSPQGQRARPNKYAKRLKDTRGRKNERRSLQQYQPVQMPPMPMPPPGMPPFDMRDPMGSFFAMQQAMGMLPGLINTHGAPAPDIMPLIAAFDTGYKTNPPAIARSHRSRRQANNEPLATIVVKRIPEKNLTEEQIRDFFGQYGDITEVVLHPESASALVTYQDGQSAGLAYESPKAIFDNRFVTVGWPKPHWKGSSRQDNPRNPASAAKDSELSRPEAQVEMSVEEIALRQEELQRKHDEAKKQREDVLKQRKQLDEQILAIETQRRKTAADLAQKTGQPADSEETQLLKAQLARLEAEAVSLGIDPDAPGSSTSEARHAFRGRGGYRGRGRGHLASYNPSHGPWSAGGGRVNRLDNRPKTVAIKFEDGTYEAHEEELRQFLLLEFAGGESAALSKHPMHQDSALIEFKVRYLAENFMTAVAKSRISSTGPITLSWYRPDDTNAQDVPMEETATGNEPAVAANVEPARPDEASYDLDVDEDRWE